MLFFFPKYQFLAIFYLFKESNYLDILIPRDAIATCSTCIFGLISPMSRQF